MKTAIKAILAPHPKRLALAGCVVLGACSQAASSESPGDGGLVNCAPLEYISDGVCTSLVINGLPDAAGWMNDPGPDGESDGREAMLDASILDGFSGGDADAVDSSGASGSDLDSSAASGPDLDALDVDVQCEGGTPVPVCVEYFAAVSACTGQNMLFAACQEGLLETPDADVASIEALCEGNLQRLGCY